MWIWMILMTMIPAPEQDVVLTPTIEWAETSKLPAASTIYYSKDKPLTWNDFKGVPQLQGRSAAITVSGFGYTAGIYRSDDQNTIHIKVYCFFDKEKSWVKPDRKTPYVLNHEQLHFDISYLATMEFVKAVRETRFTDKNYKSLLPALYEKGVQSMHAMQDEYDNETRNGLEPDVQEKWNARLEKAVSEATF
ncbi:MAG TPA: hypothetical protein PKY29_04130 [Ferruginibacter sp.]|nr:hypothetical protein [Ferruginibacter sp.]HRO17649.1 hypothetical protein [Ferruginibacter sp.]HRQ20475.1 hypothetical protein [Ferruginibacter sp.]